MQKHTKIYMDYFGLSEGDYIGSELSNSPSGPPHHIILKSAGGKDVIENIMALTPEEHELAHFRGTMDKSKWLRADYLTKKHLSFKKRYDENNTTTDKIIATKLKRYGTLNFWTEETTKKMLDTRMKKYGKLNFLGENTYSRCKRGWETIGGKKYYFRSSWETNYAHYLEWLKSKKEIKEWRYETKTFWFEGIRRGVRSYLPDFEVTINNGNIEYHEVKGYMDSRSKTKIKRMAKYYPKIKLIVIEKEEYNAIKKWARMITGWI